MLNVRSEINRQLTVQIFIFKVLSSLCILDSVDIDHLANAIADLNANFINSMFQTRDIYNLKTQLRRENIESLTSVPTLIKQLNQND
jgi:hypothetical protein